MPPGSHSTKTSFSRGPEARAALAKTATAGEAATDRPSVSVNAAVYHGEPVVFSRAGAYIDGGPRVQ